MYQDPEKYVQEHQDIIDALNGKNKKNPVKCMEAHVDRVRRSFIDFYKKFGPSF